MSLLCLGLSHHTAPVAVRERLSYSEDALKAALARLGCGRPSSPQSIRELVILATCNRVELYAWTTGEDDRALAALLAEGHGVAPESLAPYLYRYHAAAAVEHLLRVA